MLRNLVVVLFHVMPLRLSVVDGYCMVLWIIVIHLAGGLLSDLDLFFVAAH